MIQWVALLHSVTIAASRRVTRGDLSDIAASLGFSDARTVLSTGNLIFGAMGDEADLTQRIESRIAETLGRSVPVLLRRATDFQALRLGNPFPDANPARVAVRVMRHETSPADLARLHGLSTAEVTFASRERALWVLTPGPTASSPLIRAMSQPHIGAGTFRNASALAKISAALD